MTGLRRQIVLVTLTVLMLATNLLVGTGSFTEDGAEGAVQSVYYLYPTGFTPAPFTFAIWLPIFLGCVVLATIQALPRHRHDPTLDRFAVPYAGALVANALTPFAPIGWGLIVVIALFGTLARAYRELTRRGHAPWFFRVPVALFAAWASVASVLNASQVLVSRGVAVDALAAAVLVTAVMAAGAWVVRRTGEITVVAVMAWAGLGIAVRQSDATLLVVTVVLTTAASVWVAAGAVRARAV